MKIEVIAIIIGQFETNCYLAWDRESSEGIIIDPGDEPDLIVRELKRLRIEPKGILLTHGHGDHIGGVTPLTQEFAIPLYAGLGEEELLRSPEKNFSAALGQSVTCSLPERFLGDGETVMLGSLNFSVLSTPGHSPGGTCYYGGGLLFCGDTLFCGSVGRTDLPGGNHEQLLRSIIDKLLVLPDDTICYPGHGPATTIGQEKTHNPFINGSYFV